MAVPHHYFVEVDVAGYRAAVRVNGFGVLTPWRGIERTVTPINLWLIDGNNTLEVELIEASSEVTDMAMRPPPDDGEEPTPKRWFFAGVGVEHDVPEGAMPGENAPHMLVDLYGNDAGLARYELPIELETTFDVSSPFPRWRWQDGAPVALDDPQVKGELVAYLEHLHGLASARDVDGLMQQLSGVLSDTAQAYGQPLGALKAGLTQLYRDQFSAPGFRVAPFDAEALVPRAHCGGRVIELIDNGGAALIRQDDPGDGWLLPLFVAQLNGAFSIVSV